MKGHEKLALMIDGENISCKHLEKILYETAKLGRATHKRIYGDWSSPNLSAWKKAVQDNSLVPVQQFGCAAGKNSTDSRMIIDAMEILHSGNVSGFVLVSSDSDYTPLATHLREKGMTVVGMGESKTPRPFVNACDEFRFLDRSGGERPAGKPDGAGPDACSTAWACEALDRIRRIVDECCDANGEMLASELGNRVVSGIPDFRVGDHGFRNLTEFLESSDLFEIRREPMANSNGAHVYVRNRFPCRGPSEGSE